MAAASAGVIASICFQDILNSLAIYKKEKGVFKRKNPAVIDRLRAFCIGQEATTPLTLAQQQQLLEIVLSVDEPTDKRRHESYEQCKVLFQCLFPHTNSEWVSTGWIRWREQRDWYPQTLIQKVLAIRPDKVLEVTDTLEVLRMACDPKTYALKEWQSAALAWLTARGYGADGVELVAAPLLAIKGYGILSTVEETLTPIRARKILRTQDPLALIRILKSSSWMALLKLDQLLDYADIRTLEACLALLETKIVEKPALVNLVISYPDDILKSLLIVLQALLQAPVAAGAGAAGAAAPYFALSADELFNFISMLQEPPEASAPVVGEEFVDAGAAAAGCGGSAISSTARTVPAGINVTLWDLFHQVSTWEPQEQRSQLVQWLLKAREEVAPSIVLELLVNHRQLIIRLPFEGLKSWVSLQEMAPPLKEVTKNLSLTHRNPVLFLSVVSELFDLGKIFDEATLTALAQTELLDQLMPLLGIVGTEIELICLLGTNFNAWVKARTLLGKEGLEENSALLQELARESFWSLVPSETEQVSILHKIVMLPTTTTNTKLLADLNWYTVLRRQVTLPALLYKAVTLMSSSFFTYSVRNRWSSTWVEYHATLILNQADVAEAVAIANHLEFATGSLTLLPTALENAVFKEHLVSLMKKRWISAEFDELVREEGQALLIRVVSLQENLSDGTAAVQAFRALSEVEQQFILELQARSLLTRERYIALMGLTSEMRAWLMTVFMQPNWLSLTHFKKLLAQVTTYNMINVMVGGFPAEMTAFSQALMLMACERISVARPPVMDAAAAGAGAGGSTGSILASFSSPTIDRTAIDFIWRVLSATAETEQNVLEHRELGLVLDIAERLTQIFSSDADRADLIELINKVFSVTERDQLLAFKSGLTLLEKRGVLAVKESEDFSPKILIKAFCERRSDRWQGIVVGWNSVVAELPVKTGIPARDRFISSSASSLSQRAAMWIVYAPVVSPELSEALNQEKRSDSGVTQKAIFSNYFGFGAVPEKISYDYLKSAATLADLYDAKFNFTVFKAVWQLLKPNASLAILASYATEPDEVKRNDEAFRALDVKKTEQYEEQFAERERLARAMAAEQAAAMVERRQRVAAEELAAMERVRAEEAVRRATESSAASAAVAGSGATSAAASSEVRGAAGGLGDVLLDAAGAFLVGLTALRVMKGGGR